VKRSRIIAALLAVIVTASIFAVPYFARGVDSLMDLGTYYFYVVDGSEEKK